MRILVIKPSSLGDIIHTLPAIRIIKKNLPQAHISWIISDQFRRFAELLGDVDEIILFKRREWAKIQGIFDLLRFFCDLRNKYFDLVLDFQGLLRSGILTFFVKSPVKIGFAKAREGSTFFYSKKIVLPKTIQHAVEKNIFLVKEVFQVSESYLTPNIITSSDATTTAQSLLKKFNLEKCRHLLAVAPASRWESKTWPSFFFPR